MSDARQRPQTRTAAATEAKRRLAQARAAGRLREAGWLCLAPDTPAREARRATREWARGTTTSE